MMDITVRNNAVIDWIVGKANWAASKSKKEISNEMKPEKIVQKNKGENSKSKAKNANWV